MCGTPLDVWKSLLIADPVSVEISSPDPLPACWLEVEITTKQRSSFTLKLRVTRDSSLTWLTPKVMFSSDSKFGRLQLDKWLSSGLDTLAGTRSP